MQGRPASLLTRMSFIHRKKPAGPPPPVAAEPVPVSDTLSAPRGIVLGLIFSAIVWGLLATLLL